MVSEVKDMENIYLALADEVDSTKEIGEKLEPREFYLIIKAKNEKEALKYANEYLNDTYYNFGIPNDFEDITEKRTPTVKLSADEYEKGVNEFVDGLDNVLAEGAGIIARAKLGEVPEAISFSSSLVIRNRMNSFVMSRSSQSLFTENSTEGLSIKYPPSSVMGIGTNV